MENDIDDERIHLMIRGLLPVLDDDLPSIGVTAMMELLIYWAQEREMARDDFLKVMGDYWDYGEGIGQ